MRLKKTLRSAAFVILGDTWFNRISRPLILVYMAGSTCNIKKNGKIAGDSVHLQPLRNIHCKFIYRCIRLDAQEMKRVGYHLSVDERNHAFLRVLLSISFFLHCRAQRYSTCRPDKTAQAKAVHLSSSRLANRCEARASTWNWKAWFLLSADNWYPIFLSLWKAGHVLLRQTCCWVKTAMLKTLLFFGIQRW